MLCVDIEGWEREVGGRLKRKGIYVYSVIHIVVQQELTQHGKAIAVVQSLSLGATLCDPVDCSTPGFPVLHCLPEFAQTHAHGVGDAIQPSHPLSSPPPPALNLSQQQGLFR